MDTSSFTSPTEALCNTALSCTACHKTSSDCYWCETSSTCGSIHSSWCSSVWAYRDGCPSDYKWGFIPASPSAWVYGWWILWGTLLFLLPLLLLHYLCARRARQAVVAADAAAASAQRRTATTQSPRRPRAPPLRPAIVHPVPVYTYAPAGPPHAPPGPTYFGPPPPPLGEPVQAPGVSTQPPEVPVETPPPPASPPEQPNAASPHVIPLNLVVGSIRVDDNGSPRYAGAERVSPTARDLEAHRESTENLTDFQPTQTKHTPRLPTSVEPVPTKLVISPRVQEPTVNRLRQDLAEQREQNENLRQQVAWLNTVIKKQ
eukprot:Blabericola_migrator_1__10986@NODE_636_length_7124_cov_153_319683_g467_i0_p2_GENE_NODE_636_length_7124_cov_153_319683_g467_i0NODE_636_length_7124_cov_153_319683_g467_i0_p2_ORF_typecomplete_len317_score21_37BatA/PF07584_11/0_0073DUF4381/PF14316_6/0_02DUF4381/PF14316_6/1e04UPF0242/PF06785_11/66UPF0242/PF06785_11/1_7Macoilin/PF09726_9/0_087DivIC/PF04977_15/0_16FUSClike/PF12805_7/0_24PSI_integrin/PF17205_3/14_NODE_636_length_7124_cov_153_319683_g467_i09271877